MLDTNTKDAVRGLVMILVMLAILIAGGVYFGWFATMAANAKNVWDVAIMLWGTR